MFLSPRVRLTAPSDLLRIVGNDSTISEAYEYSKACLKSPENPALLSLCGTCTPVPTGESVVSSIPQRMATTEWQPQGESLAWLLRKQKVDGRHFGVIYHFHLQREIVPSSEASTQQWLGSIKQTPPCVHRYSLLREKNHVLVPFAKGKIPPQGRESQWPSPESVFWVQAISNQI